jgi:hypothetical protein
MAWWLLDLDPNDINTLGTTEVPPRAAYLYRFLATTWRDPAASTTQAH